MHLCLISWVALKTGKDSSFKVFCDDLGVFSWPRRSWLMETSSEYWDNLLFDNCKPCYEKFWVYLNLHSECASSQSWNDGRSLSFFYHCVTTVFQGCTWHLQSSSWDLEWRVSPNWIKNSFVWGFRDAPANPTMTEKPILCYWEVNAVIVYSCTCDLWVN